MPQHKGSPESTATPWHCQSAWHDPLGTTLLPKSNPGPPRPRNSPVPPARLREHAQHHRQESNRLINTPLLAVLPALIHQHENLQGDALRNNSPSSPTSNREGPTILAQRPQNQHVWHLQWPPKFPKMLLPLQQAGPASLPDRDLKATAPFHRITMTTNAWPPSSGRFPGPPPMPPSQQRREEAALGQPCTKGSHGHPSQQQQVLQRTPGRVLSQRSAQGGAGSW